MKLVRTLQVPHIYLGAMTLLRCDLARSVQSL